MRLVRTLDRKSQHGRPQHRSPYTPLNPSPYPLAAGEKGAEDGMRGDTLRQIGVAQPVHVH